MRQKVSVAAYLTPMVVVSGLAPRRTQGHRSVSERPGALVWGHFEAWRGASPLTTLSLAKTKQVVGIIMSRILFW